MFKQYEDFAAGNLPQSLDELTQLGRGIVAINAKVRQSLCVIVAIGRDQYIKELGEWARWVEENFNLTGSDRCNCYRVGKMLTALNGLNMFKLYKRVFSLDFDKLLQLCRLEVAEIDAFMSQHDVEGMSRAAVKVAVNVFLGQIDTAAGSGDEQLVLPGFDKTLEWFDGVDALGIARSINTPDISQKSLTVGFGLIDGAINYQINNPSLDLETLQLCRADLLDKAAKLAEMIEAKQHGNL